MGAAIGEALGYPYQGMSRRQILGKVGRFPMKYALIPGVGIPAFHTSSLYLTAQAIVCSASESKTFVDRFKRRLGWYILSCPVGLDAATFRASLLTWLRYFNVSTGSRSTDNAPATRSLFLALALNGTGARAKRWVELCTAVTHTHPLTSDGCVVLAGLAEQIVENIENFDAMEACEKLALMSKEPELRDRLAKLPDFLRAEKSPRTVANHFGWEAGINSSIIPTTIMSAYCFLRYPNDFRRAVESGIRLGGDTPAMGAIIGGLSGTNLGVKLLPKDLADGLSDFAYGPTWINGMALRMSHWPHGPNDLHSAHAEPAAIVELTITNLVRGIFLLLKRAARYCPQRNDESQSVNRRQSGGSLDARSGQIRLPS